MGAGGWLRRVAALPFHDAAALRAASEVLQAELSRLPLPQPAADEIKEQLGRFPEGTAFSVRSSSTMEDLASAAFAGQHETFLNVAGAPNVLDRVRGCFVSLWADRAVAYRHQQGFDHAQAAMAVVVQQMVPSETAGVGFSINPVNGQLGEMVINANFGLGESVVSGEGEVDQWILDKATRAVRSANIASKSRQVVSAASGTREVHLAGADAAKPSLSEGQLTAREVVAAPIAAHYDHPAALDTGRIGRAVPERHHAADVGLRRVGLPPLAESFVWPAGLPASFGQVVRHVRSLHLRQPECRRALRPARSVQRALAR
jgi:pyruvate,water dikinase